MDISRNIDLEVVTAASICVLADMDPLPEHQRWGPQHPPCPFPVTGAREEPAQGRRGWADDGGREGNTFPFLAQDFKNIS